MTTKSFQLIKRFDTGIRKFPDEKVSELFRRPARGSWLDRFSIYGTGYSVRSKEAMEEIYELLPKLMGEKKWDRLGFTYVSKFQSRSTNLSHLGNRFPEFLKREDYKKWAEVAAFELAINQSFHAFRGPKSMGVDAASKITDKSKFKFQPSTHLIESRFEVTSAWRSRAGSPKLKKRRSFALIYRLGDVVCADEVDERQYDVLQKLRRGLTLGTAVRHLKDPMKLSIWLKYWIETEIIEGLK